MDKNHVDKIISEYMEKIFGFALTKLMNTDKAEELASRITIDVYTSLLKADDVQNIDGYIYRVSSNVYARFVDEEIKGRYVSLDEVNIPGNTDFTEDIIKAEDYIRLRREVSYLGRIQREIIVMHYFQKLKLYEISERLNIPLGTVKWHLHDARNQIKVKLEGNKMREKGTLGMKPIRFTGMGHDGSPSPDGKDLSDYFTKLISQNIAYATYHEAKNITEIAEELGVSAAYIEDEVAYLHDHEFLDKVAGGKYLTNVCIDEPSKEAKEKAHLINKKYAKIVCEKYVPLIFDAMKNYDSKKIYTPENDFNFLMWSAVSFACCKKLCATGENIDISKYRIKRKDGSDYAAYASIDGDFKWSDLSYNTELYQFCGQMNRWIDNKFYSFQIDTYYDDRKGYWRDNWVSDYDDLCGYMTGSLKKESANADKFKRLFDKGYLITKGDSEYVNMVVAKMSCDELYNMLPAITDELKAVSEELDEEIFKIQKNLYPAHMQDLCRIHCTNRLISSDIITRVLEQLYADGTLKPLTDTQKRSVNTVLCCDTLPG